MRNRLVVTFVLLAIASCSNQTKDAAIEQRIQGVESGLVEFTTPKATLLPTDTQDDKLMPLSQRMADYKVPGVSIAVIGEFAPEWARAYGTLTAGGDRPVTTSSYFQAASTSKLVTAAIVLHLAGEGILDLDEDVNTYLKSWKVPENEFTAEQKVTLRRLLTHQAGLPTSNFQQQENAPAPSLAQVLNGELPAMNKPAIVEQAPGTQWQYSNLGYVVIQQILEDVISKPFSEIAQEVVFRPLGMKQSTFSYPLKPELRASEAMPHDADGNLGEPAVGPPAVAHGNLVTTPSDLAVLTAELMRAYSGASDKLLSQKMARQMFHKEIDLDPSLFGVPLGEGLGTFLYGEGEDLIFLHPGSNLPGMTCWLQGKPETGWGAVVMTNGAQGEILQMEIISAIIREYSKPSRRS